MTDNDQRGSAGRRAELAAILPNLRRFALSLAGNLADADDLLQATVLRLLERGAPERADLLPWAFKVCRNLWIDEHRARQVRQRAADAPELRDLHVSGITADGAERLAADEVFRALSDLNPDQRAVLELVAVEGYTYHRAAEVLDVPIGTVMSRLARARAALADRFERD